MFTSNNEEMRNFSNDTGQEPSLSLKPYSFTFENYNIWGVCCNDELSKRVGGIGHFDYRKNLDIILLYSNY